METLKNRYIHVPLAVLLSYRTQTRAVCHFCMKSCDALCDHVTLAKAGDRDREKTKQRQSLPKTTDWKIIRKKHARVRARKQAPSAEINSMHTFIWITTTLKIEAAAVFLVYTHRERRAFSWMNSVLRTVPIARSPHTTRMHTLSIPVSPPQYVTLQSYRFTSRSIWIYISFWGVRMTLSLPLSAVACILLLNNINEQSHIGHETNRACIHFSRSLWIVSCAFCIDCRVQF